MPRAKTLPPEAIFLRFWLEFEPQTPDFMYHYAKAMHR